VLRETLPPARRHPGGIAESSRVFRSLLQDRTFLGAVVAGWSGNAAIPLARSQ